MRNKALLIMNPKSGTMQASKMLSDILQKFSECNYMTTVLMTTTRGDATRYAENYAADYDLLVVAGGDGTFNEVIEGVKEKNIDIPIGYIPSGSTNDFANGLGLPKTILEAAERVTTGTEKTLDIGEFNGRYFSYVASFGAFTSTTYTVPQNLKNILGHTAYILSGIKDIVNIHPIHAKIVTDKGTADERTVEGDYLFGAVCNSTSVGGIIHLNEEDVDMNDGKMEVLLIKMPKDLIEMNAILGSMMINDLDTKHIDFFSAKNLEIEIDEGTHWTLDGEYEEGAKHVEINTLESAIKIIC